MLKIQISSRFIKENNLFFTSENENKLCNSKLLRIIDIDNAQYIYLYIISICVKVVITL